MWHRGSRGEQRFRGSGSGAGQLADPELEKTLAGTLDRVEQRLYAAVSSSDPFVQEAARHLRRSTPAANGSGRCSRCSPGSSAAPRKPV